MSGNNERVKPLLKYKSEDLIIHYVKDATDERERTNDISKVNCKICIEWLRNNGLAHEDSK